MRTVATELVDMSKKAVSGRMPSISPFGPERHLLDIGRHRQRGEDDLGLLADLLWRIGPDRAFRQERLGRGAAQIVHDKLVPGLLQIGRHALAHHAEPDKSDAHLPLRQSQNRCGTSFAAAPRPSASRQRRRGATSEIEQAPP